MSFLILIISFLPIIIATKDPITGACISQHAGETGYFSNGVSATMMEPTGDPNTPYACDYLRFGATWWDEIEGIVQFTLFNQYRSQIAMWSDLSTTFGDQAQAGFQLTMSNHRLRPSSPYSAETLILASDNLQWMNDTLNTYLTLDIELSSPYTDQQLIVMSPACPLPSWVKSEPRFATILCVSLLPTPRSNVTAVGEQFLATLKSLNIDPFNTTSSYILSNTSIISPFETTVYLKHTITIPDPTLPGGLNSFQANEVVSSATHHQNQPITFEYVYEPGQMIILGPIDRYGCRQLMRRVWIYDLNFTVVGYGSSDRGICGAPRGIGLPTEQSVVIGQTASWHVDPIATAISNDVRMGLWQSARDLIAATPFGVQLTNIILISYNDRGDPIQAAINAQRLIQHDYVLAIVGATGVDTTQAILNKTKTLGPGLIWPSPVFSNRPIPITNLSRNSTYPIHPIYTDAPEVTTQAHGTFNTLDILLGVKSTNLPTPLICPQAGTRSFFKPYDPSVINIRVSYDDELAQLVSNILSSGSADIAVVYQNNTFGQQSYQSLQLLLALKGRSISRSTMIRVSPYSIYNQTNAARTISTISRGIGGGRPSYVVILADAPYVAQVIMAGRMAWLDSDTRYSPVIYAVTSYTHGAYLQQLLVSAGSPAFIQSQPSLPSSSQSVAAATFPKYGWYYDEAYLCGYLIHQSIVRASDIGLYTRDSVMATIKSDLPYIPRTGYTLGPFVNCSTGGHHTTIVRFREPGNREYIGSYPIQECGVNVFAPGPDALIFGQTAALTGSIADVGTSMRDGLLVAFREINDQGGINGRVLSLVTLDDGYNETRALNNAKTLVETYNVIGILGSVGTPTADAMIPYLTSRNIPLLFPYSGGRSLRVPYSRMILNLRASYDDEFTAFIRYAIGIGKEVFSLMSVNDPDGATARLSFQTSLWNQGLALISEGYYIHDTMNISDGLKNITSNPVQPQVIVCIGTTAPIALFISEARKYYPTALFYSISFIGAESLATALANYNITQNVIMTQVMPILSTGASDLLQDRYAKAMFNYCAACTLSSGSLEGYIAAQVLIQTFQRLGPISMSSLTSYIRESDNILFSNITTEQLRIVPPVTSASISTSLSSTILTSLDTDATSASSLSLRNPTILSILRDWFLTTVYNSGIFAINEFRIGPFTPNACEGKNLDCLQSKSQACNQGSHLVFISRLKSINNTNIFIEDVKWRYQTSSDECTINAYMIPADQTPIVFSQSGPLTGFNAQLGLEIRQGIRAAFANINAANGINGRKLILQTFDDNFSPERQAANLRMVIQLNKTLAILGSGPTANIQAILPTVTDAGIPLVGSIGGARDWRFPFNPYLIQLRATYDDECAAMLQWLKLNNKTRIVGVFADDAGGRSIADALQLALSYNKLSMHAFSAYNVAAANIADTFLTIEYQMGWRTQSEYDALLQRSTVFAPNSYAQQMIYDYAPNHGAARTSRAAPPDVFITGGSYQGILSLLTYSQNAANQATYKDAWYVSTLFTGIEKFRASISSSILQHVPVYMTSSFIQPEPPTSTTDSGIGHALSNYYKGMETLDPEYDPPLYTQVTLEGYIIGRIVVDHLQEAKTITSIGLMNAIYNNGIGDTYAGFQVGPYGKGCNAGIRNIRMEQLTYENTTHVPVVYNFTAGSTSECGIYQKYIDPPCSLGYRKIYTSADTLESICVACPAGRYGPDGLKCLICPAGSYSAGTAANCTLCPQGYFQDRAGQFQCEACPIGSWSSSINATKCISCEPGAITFTSASTNKSSCTCAPGFYSQRTMGILPSRDQDPDALLCRACTNSDWINSGCLLNDAGPGPGIRSTILALTVISMVATAVVAILTYKFRRAPVVKAASPPILLMMLAGAELGYITNIIALPYPQTTNTCMIQPYFAYVGFALLFGGLFAKTYRVGRIFNQKHIVKIKITNADLTKVVRVLIIIFLILIILWHIMDPAKPMITDNGNEEFTWCTQDQHVWAIAPLVFAYIVLIYGVYLCYKNRNITSFFNETKHISIILYNTMFVGTVFVAAYMLIVTTEQQATLVMSLGVLVVINVAVGVLFIPKLKTVWKGMTDVNSNNSQLGESGSSHHSGHDSGHFNLSGSGDGSIQLSQLMASHAHLQKKVKMMMTTEAKMKALITSLEDQVAHYYPKYEKGVRLQRIMQQQAAAAATSSQRRHSADQPRSQLSTGEKTGARVSSVGDKDIGLKSSTISPTVVSRSSQVPNTTKQPLMGPDRYRSSSISNGTGTDTGAARSPSLEMVVSIRDSPARGNTSVLPERERASPPTSNRLFMSPDDLAPRPIRRSVAESSGVSRSNSIDQKEKEPDSTSQHESSSHQPFKLSPSPNQPARRRLSIGTTPAKGTGTPKVAPMNATAAGTTPSTSTSPSTSPQVHPSTLTDVPSLT